ncbi:tetratricopeptide repeat protein [Flavobacterium sp.]|uniref:tetratricopeptide repeat protein n=1 Tax=Flavobacterium sp. TaxID=239 RepID=UPI003D6B3B91
MKKTLFLFFLTTACFSQETYTRKHFIYTNLKASTEECSDEIKKNLNEAYKEINENRSAKAVEIAENLFKNNNCPETYDTYALSLFRSGEVIKGVELLETAIEKFGSNPLLIKRRSLLLLELIENGIGQKNIDGNTVYTSKDKSLNYNEEKFKAENLETALEDLNYLADNFKDRFDEIYTIGKVYQLQKEFEKSNVQFQKIVEIPEMKDQALFNMAENYLELKNYNSAEENLLKLLKSYPKEPQLLAKLSELYKLNGDTAKSELLNKQRYFHQLVPGFCEMEFSEKNLEIIDFFKSSHNNYKTKLEKLKEIEKNESQKFTIETCITILNIHTNHGNGLEEGAVKLLIKIGKPALDEVHKLFGTNVSTCTITNLAEIMATLKDESSWQIMADYVPNIAKMPATLIPPDVPKYLVKFNEERGLKELLKIIQPLLSEETPDDAMGQLSFMTRYIYYEPLKKISFKKIESICKEIGYNEKEIKQIKKSLI